MSVKIIIRHDSAANWETHNPTLSAGELGFDTTSGKYKLGTGSTAWNSLAYAGMTSAEISTAISEAVAGVIDLAPGALDTLNELAAAINDDPNFFSTISTSLETKQDKVSGVSDTEIGYLDGVTSAIQIQLDAKASSTALSDHASDTANIHGIADTSLLETATGAQSKATTAETAAKTYALGLVTDHVSDTTNVHGIADTGLLETATGAQTKADTAEQNAIDAAIAYADSLASGYDAAGQAANALADAELAISNHASDTSTHGVSTSIAGTGDIQTFTNKTMGDDLLMDGNQISGLGTPTQGDHAATKAYVDGMSESLNIHDAVKVATTANITISTALVAGQSLDGVTLAANDRVLVKNQTTTSQNGIYVVQSSGAAVRAADYNSVPEVESGDFIFVTSGTVNASTGWVQTATIATLGSDPILFTQFSGAGTYIAGTGIVLNSNTFSVDDTVVATRTFAQDAADTAETNAASTADSKIVAHNDLTQNVHGILDTNELATKEYADTSSSTAVSSHNLDTTNVHGITDMADLVNTAGLASEIASHASTTLNVHGIADTTALLTDTDKTALEGQIDAKADIDSPTFTGTVVLPSTTSIGTVTNLEIGLLSGLTANSTELNVLHGISASTAELNILDGVTATTAELNILDGITASTGELNILDGVTATAAELNILDGITASTAELNKLDGVTASTVELNYVTGITSSIQDQLDDKAPINSPTFTGTVGGVTKAMVGLGNVDNTSDANKPISTATQTALDAKASSTDLSTHASDTTSVHGIADTSLLETTSGAQSKADAAETAANGYTDTAINALDTDDIEEGATNLYFTNERAQDAVGNSVGTGLQYDDTSGAISLTLGSTGSITVNGSGVLDVTSNVVKEDSTQTLYNKTIDTADNDITVVAADISDVTASAAELNILDGATLTTTELNYVDGVTSSIQGQLDDKSPLASPTFTGTAHVNDLVIDGELTFSGTATTISSTNLEVTDSLIYLAAEQFDTDAIDIGIFGAYGDSNPGHYHTGLVRDASDGKWKLISNGDEPVNNVIDFTGVTYDTLKLGSIEATSASIGDVSNTELQYLNGVTSAVQTQLDSKAPIDSPTFTGTVSGITKSMVSLGNVDNTSDADKPISSATQTALDAKAPLASPTFTGTVTLPTGTVTSGMIADGTIVNGDISSSAAIAVSKLEASTISGVTLGSDLNALTIGTGLSGTSYDGSSAVTVAIDSSVATLTDSQTLTNKTLTAPSLTTPTVSSGTLTVASDGVTFSDGTVQSTAGVPSLTTIKSAISGATSTSTLSSPLTYRDSLVAIAGAYAVTIDADGTNSVTFPIGTSINFYQSSGAGGASIVQGSGVTLLATPGLVFRALYSSVTITKVAADTWLVYGDLKA